MVDLSVIILSYNTQEITKQCLQSLVESLSKSSIHSEIIVIDNASSDGSVEMIKAFEKEHQISNIIWKCQYNTENVGYPKGNNQGFALSSGTFILLLNSDVIVEQVDFSSLLKYMNENPNAGVLTVKVNLPSGGIDPASHRGFPTIWNSFCYFTKLEKIFGRLPVIGKFFGGYHLTHLNLLTIHEIDAPAGAFFLTRKSVIEKTQGFDEQFFMYGEDLDLAYRIKKEGFKVIYYPLFHVLHLKRSSGLEKKDPEIRKRTRKCFYDAMKIFFKKHYASNYPNFVNQFIYWSIDLKSKLS
jgi:GT2 family glycosyltransferase